MVAMETRKERYSKYREQIRHMREGEFPKVDNGAASVATEGGDVSSVPNQLGTILPYELYLRHRRKMLVFKVLALALAIAGFVVWWFLMQRR